MLKMRLLCLCFLAILSISSVVSALGRFGGNDPIIKSIPPNIKNDLASRLSEKAQVTLPGEELYDDLIVKYSDFNRPTFSVAVAVASIDDVVETVRTERVNMFGHRNDF